jgi:hypothetical protein
MRRWLLRLVLLAIAAGLGGLAWDVAQLRALKPPSDPTFEGFLRDGRVPASLRLEEINQTLSWTGRPPRTLLPHPEPPVYLFGRSGRLLDWTPGAEPGMFSGAPLRARGQTVDLDRARAWLRPAR